MNRFVKYLRAAAFEKRMRRLYQRLRWVREELWGASQDEKLPIELRRRALELCVAVQALMTYDWDKSQAGGSPANQGGLS